MNILDAHSDYGIYIYRQKQTRNIDELGNYITSLHQGGVKWVCLQVGGDFLDGTDFDCGNFANIKAVINENLRQFAFYPNDIHLIQSARDLDHNALKDQIGILFSIEGARAIDLTQNQLQLLYDVGLRSVALTHNLQNQYALGCLDPNHPQDSGLGLTALGRKLVQNLNQLPMIVDLVHTSERSFWDILDVLEKPPVVSHSNCRVLSETPRNLTDRQIEAVGKHEGVIGINFMNKFLTQEHPDASTQEIIQHIRHITHLIGIDHVGLGPDFAQYLGFSGYPTDVSDSSKMQLLVVALEQAGFSHKDIQKISYSNFLRVYKTCLQS